MKVTIERAKLLKALGRVQRVVERRTTIPILSNVLLRAEDGRVTLKATDLDLEVTEAFDASVGEAGATTLPAHTLHDIVRKLPDAGEVTLETAREGAEVHLRAGRSRFVLQCLPASDFPDLAVGEMGHAFSLPGRLLKGMLESTAFAMSTEETRYYLNGVYVHSTQEGGSQVLRMVATDGHRLARVEVPAPKGSESIPGVIVPRKAASEALRLVEDPDAEVAVTLSNTKVRLTFGSVVLMSKLIDGTFPDYTRVIPAGNDKALVVDRVGFSAAVDRVSTISAERGRAVRLGLGDDKATLVVNNPDAGTATEELDVGYSAAPIEVGFNARYLVDILSQLTSEKATMMLSDPGSPVRIEGGEGSGALFVLMPMRV